MPLNCRRDALAQIVGPDLTLVKNIAGAGGNKEIDVPCNDHDRDRRFARLNHLTHPFERLVGRRVWQSHVDEHTVNGADERQPLS